MDWDDLRIFLAIARHGTLSSAARSLALTQPTVGRRLSAFEKQLGAQLFERTSAGFSLSEVGRAMLQHAHSMEEHALAAETLSAGRHAGISGVVRVTASEWVIRSLLGPGLGPLIRGHARLTLELSADARHLSLVRREADIALRPSQFTHQEIVQRELADLTFGLYASDGYLARHGVPNFAAGAEGHVFVQMTDGLANLADYEWLPSFARGARVAVRTNGREPMATMASAGIGISCLPRILGDRTPGLRLLKTPLPSPRRKLYLGVHRAARKTPRVRVVIDSIVQLMAELKVALCPEV